MATTTAREIITAALRRIGVVASDEPPTASEAQDALIVLNEMLESWSLENLMLTSEIITATPLTTSKQIYTIGSGGDIGVTWPLEITQAQLRITTQTPNLELPVAILNEQEFGRIRLKALESTYVQSLYLHNTYPLANLYVWPVPNISGTTLITWAKQIVADFTTLDTSVNFPRGYARAIRYNLAIELADEYGRVATPTLVTLAVDAREKVKQSNSKVWLATVDAPAGQQGRYGAYNWRSDTGT